MHSLVRTLSVILATSALALAGCGSDDGAKTGSQTSPVSGEGTAIDDGQQPKVREPDAGDEASCVGNVGKRSAECLEQGK